MLGWGTGRRIYELGWDEERGVRNNGIGEEA